MASVSFTDSYSVSGYGETDFAVRVNYTEKSYDMAANKTTIRVSSVEIMSSRTVSGPVYGTVKINGATIVSFTGGYACTASPSAGSYAQISGFDGAEITVAHNELGAASMTVSLTGGSGGVFGISFNGKMFGVETGVSTSVALTAHPRASSISSCPSSANTNTSITLTVSRNSTAFYHKASFRVGSATLAESGAFASSLSYSIPRAWFDGYGSAVSLSVTVSVQTYTDSACISPVGSPATAAMTVTADAGMKPSVSAGWVTLTPYNSGTAAAGFSGYIKGFSKARAVFDPSKISLANTAGASIASYSLSCQGSTDSASPYETPVLNAASAAVVCTVTDTRGRSASESFTLSVLDYAPPLLSGVAVFRCGSGGTAAEAGTYYSVKAALSFSTVGGQNSCTLSAAIAPSGGSYGAERTLASGTASVFGTISADASYTVRISAADSLGGRVVYYASIPTRKWAMKFRENGKGVAFGKAAETDNTFEISPDWAVKLGAATASGNLEVIRPGEVNIYANDTYTGHNISLCSGASGKAGLYDNTHNKWLIDYDINGNCHVNNERMGPAIRLSAAYTQNDLVTSAAFNRLHPFDKNGFLLLVGNMLVSSGAATSNFTEIGKLTGWSAIDAFYATVPPQSVNQPVITVSITSSGSIQLYRAAAATSESWYRFTAIVPKP